MRSFLQFNWAGRSMAQVAQCVRLCVQVTLAIWWRHAQYDVTTSRTGVDGKLGGGLGWRWATLESELRVCTMQWVEKLTVICIMVWVYRKWGSMLFRTMCAHFLSDIRASCVCCRCFSDVKTALCFSIATLLSTPLDLEIPLENSGSVRFIKISVEKFCNWWKLILMLNWALVNNMNPLLLFFITPKAGVAAHNRHESNTIQNTKVTRKLCYRKDDRAMCAI